MPTLSIFLEAAERIGIGVPHAGYNNCRTLLLGMCSNTSLRPGDSLAYSSRSVARSSCVTRIFSITLLRHIALRELWWNGRIISNERLS